MIDDYEMRKNFTEANNYLRLISATLYNIQKILETSLKQTETLEKEIRVVWHEPEWPGPR